MHHNYCASAGFSQSQRGQIIDYVCTGGNLLIMPICWDDVAPHNALLTDSRWMTGLTYGGCGGFIHTTNIAPLPPLTDGISYLHFEITSQIFANPPAYPFVWNESGSQVIAAVSYPYRLDGNSCDCHLGGRIIAIADGHTFETGVVGYTEPMDFRFMINTMTALAHVDADTMSNCFTPGIPRLDSIPCASPGQIAHLYGDHIPVGVTGRLDGVPIAITRIDSTHITFTVPSNATQGYHTVTIIAGGREYSIQIRVYCNWEVLTRFDLDCADIGDTVWFYGENFLLSAVVYFAGTALPASRYHIVNSTSGWFIVPDTTGRPFSGTWGSSRRYQVCVHNSATQQDCMAFLVPCPCPSDSEIAASIENIRFWERTDGTDTVYIIYDLNATSPQNIVLYCSSDGGVTWAVPCTTCFGAVGNGVSPGDSLVIRWSAGADVPGMEGGNWLFRIEIADAGGVGSDTTLFSLFARAVGGTNYDYSYSVVQTSDGGFAVAGVTTSFGAGGADFFLVKFDADGNTCIGSFVSPIVTVATPTVTSPSPTVTSPSPTVTVVSPTVTVVSPTVTAVCDSSLTIFCPYGAVYASGESDPGPVDTWRPRIGLNCPPNGSVGNPATIYWTTTDSFVPPNSIAPLYSISIYFSSNGGVTWQFVGVSQNTGSFNWAYPPVFTNNAMLMVCATDSFGHTMCDTCGPFSITGDTIRPWGYAYGDTCSPDSIVFVLRDNVGIDWSTVCITDPLGVLCWPDSMRRPGTGAGDTILIFYPRLPSGSSIGDTFVVRLSYVEDLSGNMIRESVIESRLTFVFRHPCCWREGHC